MSAVIIQKYVLFLGCVTLLFVYLSRISAFMLYRGAWLNGKLPNTKKKGLKTQSVSTLLTSNLNSVVRANKRSRKKD